MLLLLNMYVCARTHTHTHTHTHRTINISTHTFWSANYYDTTAGTTSKCYSVSVLAGLILRLGSENGSVTSWPLSVANGLRKCNCCMKTFHQAGKNPRECLTGVFPELSTSEQSAPFSFTRYLICSTRSFSFSLEHARNSSVSPGWTYMSVSVKPVHNDPEDPAFHWSLQWMQHLAWVNIHVSAIQPSMQWTWRPGFFIGVCDEHQWFACQCQSTL